MTTGWATWGLQQLFEWTVRTSLQTSVLILLVLVIQRVFGRWLSSQARFVLSGLVLIRLLLPIAPSSSWSLLNLAAHVQTSEQPPTPVALSESALLVQKPAPAALVAVAVSSAHARGRGWIMSVLAGIWLLGAGLSVLAVLWQHRRVSRWVRAQPRTADPALRTLLDSCRADMGVSRSVELVPVHGTAAPALFGWLRPRLLLPAAALGALSESELRLVFLHELAHVRRHDILLNWAMIVLQGWHWFNPLVRLSMRRLRADRELICDAMVLRRLSRTEQRLYGQTLLKLLEMVAPPRLSASLVPVVNTKQELKNRITMISIFKPSRPAAWALTIALALLVGCFTFTKAADQAKKPATTEAVPIQPESVTQPESPRPASGVQVLEQKVKQQDERVRAAEREVDALRQNLAPGDESGLNGTDGNDAGPDMIRMIERERISTEARLVQYGSLLKQLEERTGLELRQMLPTAVPDELLRSLLERLSVAETESARLSTEFGPDDSRLKATAAAVRNINKQIDERVQGILAGLRAQMRSQQATVSSLKDRVAVAKEEDAKLRERYRPYFVAKHELETQRRIRETLMLRLLQETVDAALPKH